MTRLEIVTREEVGAALSRMVQPLDKMAIDVPDPIFGKRMKRLSECRPITGPGYVIEVLLYRENTGRWPSNPWPKAWGGP